MCPRGTSSASGLCSAQKMIISSAKIFYCIWSEFCLWHYVNNERFEPQILWSVWQISYMYNWYTVRLYSCVLYHCPDEGWSENENIICTCHAYTVLASSMHHCFFFRKLHWKVQLHTRYTCRILGLALSTLPPSINNRTKVVFCLRKPKGRNVSTILFLFPANVNTKVP